MAIQSADTGDAHPLRSKADTEEAVSPNINATYNLLRAVGCFFSCVDKTIIIRHKHTNKTETTQPWINVK